MSIDEHMAAWERGYAAGMEAAAEICERLEPMYARPFDNGGFASAIRAANKSAGDA